MLPSSRTSRGADAEFVFRSISVQLSTFCLNIGLLNIVLAAISAAHRNDGQSKRVYRG